MPTLTPDSLPVNIIRVVGEFHADQTGHPVKVDVLVKFSAPTIRARTVR